MLSGCGCARDLGAFLTLSYYTSRTEVLYRSLTKVSFHGIHLLYKAKEPRQALLGTNFVSFSNTQANISRLGFNQTEPNASFHISLRVGNHHAHVLG